MCSSDLFTETQQGLSFARNRGIQEAQGEILLFLDDDAFMQKNYLHRLVLYLKNHPDAAAFGGKITPFYENGQIPEWMSILKANYGTIIKDRASSNRCLFTTEARFYHASSLISIFSRVIFTTLF